MGGNSGRQGGMTREKEVEQGIPIPIKLQHEKQSKYNNDDIMMIYWMPAKNFQIISFFCI